MYHGYQSLKKLNQMHLKDLLTSVLKQKRLQFFKKHMFALYNFPQKYENVLKHASPKVRGVFIKNVFRTKQNSL